MKQFVRITILFLLVQPIWLWGQSSQYLNYSGQWQRNISENCLQEFLTLGQDKYFVWVSEGDPCNIYTIFGTWRYSNDSLFLSCKIILSDEDGSGNYYHFLPDSSESYLLILRDDKLFVIGKYLKINNELNFIDYCLCNDCLFEIKYPNYFKTL